MISEDNQMRVKAQALLIDVLKCIVTSIIQPGSTLKLDSSDGGHNSVEGEGSRSTEKLPTQESTEEIDIQRLLICSQIFFCLCECF